ncbi:hypothetical protein MAPG_05690 [Magnaporthiopsis poae ATCC 64411]|uniref:Uncharacterized protein n=1 Tax=Magnaporthiopsis poae (strain ATCC 64411 / 73-15) TaxID=644358 RepID=A0A0C4E024_MAGP6|nr:hypothetical protein MAPG_05690 [Magnaporthiopsis poae ATCC 64411]
MNGSFYIDAGTGKAADIKPRGTQTRREGLCIDWVQSGRSHDKYTAASKTITERPKLRVAWGGTRRCQIIDFLWCVGRA